MDRQTAIDILTRYRSGNCNETERLLVENWILQSEVSPLDLSDYQLLEDLLDIRFRLERDVHKKMPTRELRDRRRFSAVVRRLPYAAAALIILAVGFWMAGDQIVNRKSAGNRPQSASINPQDIAPGTNRATLTLADGRAIHLSEAQTGIRQQADGVTYADGNHLIADNDSDHSTQISHHMLATPKGGTYRITLADGTEVWLNAASRLKYPSAFTSGERVVELEGEGYFVVAKDKNRPFKVISSGQEVEVLGTEFNISAYADEPAVKTTLAAGAVQIVNRKSAIVNRIKPGTQSIIRGSTTNVHTVDVEQYIAWKSGSFYFEGTDSQTAFNQLSRWYDLEIVYQGKIPAVRFYGVIGRDKSLTAVLDILKEAGLKFNIEKTGGVNKLIVINE